MEWQWERRPLAVPLAWNCFASSPSPPAPFDPTPSHADRTRTHTRTTKLSTFVHINSTTRQHDQRTLSQADDAAERIDASARRLVSAALRRSPRRPTRRRRLQTVLQLTRSVTAC